MDIEEICELFDIVEQTLNITKELDFDMEILDE